MDSKPVKMVYPYKENHETYAVAEPRGIKYNTMYREKKKERRKRAPKQTTQRQQLTGL